MAATAGFRYIAEQGDEFLALFPHRFDFICAEHPDPSQSPHWQTESRYPLSDRLILDGAELYGVRFGAQTRYCLLDIDSGSSYHPQTDAFAIGRMLAALEPLGFTDSLICRSSYRGGVHVYLPFQQAQASWALAACVAALLENAGFKLNPGQLELFPNPKSYISNGKPALFNAHRLPLQAGFYLLNQDFQPIWSDRSSFVKRWQFAASRNTVTTRGLRQLLKQHRRKHYRISGKADKFLNDLDTEIEQGWTGQGQTNRLLGRIALRTYIFHHVLQGGEPLTGQLLVDQIVAIARSLPGYQDWCRHQHEIEQRAAEWARCAESSHYFHYTHRSAAQTPAPAANSLNDRSPSWNQQQRSQTREKICSAIADLLNQNSLPAKATARFQALLQYGIGGGSLYRHRDLWHPSFLDSSASPQDTSDCFAHASVENQSLVENPPHPPTSVSARPFDQLKSGPNGLSCTSLFPGNGGNVSPVQGSGDRWLQESKGQFDRAERLYQLRIQQFLNSGDPILIAEAQSSQRSRQGDLSSEFVGLSSAPSLNLRYYPSQTSLDRCSSVYGKVQDEIQDEVQEKVQRKIQEKVQRSSIANDSPILSGQNSFSRSAEDVSELLAAISVQVRRLCWSSDRIGDRLYQRYGKRSRRLLTENELSDWLKWLKTQ